MTTFEIALNNLAKNIKKARETEKDDGDTLVKCLMEISCTMYYLANERANFHKQFYTVVNNYILSGKSATAAKELAEFEVPQLYMLRQIMDNGQNVIDAIRTNISWIKTGLTNV